MKFRDILKSESGFTLLETLIAMTIMLIAFASIFAIQGNSLNAADRSKRMNVVGMLAKSAMVQTEVELLGKSFNEIQKEQTGTFETPYEDFSWVREVKEVKFPTLSFSNPKDEKDKKEEKNNQLQDQLGKLLAGYLKKALREVSVTVKWNRSGKVQSYVLAMYWIDTEATFDLTP